MRKRLITLALTAMTLCTGVFAQTTVNIGTAPTVTGCSFIIYDDGGATGTYGPSHNYTLTVYPASGQGRVSLQVVSLDIHQNDTLYVYDGTTASGAPMAALNNSTFSTSLNTLTIMASQGNATGALTLRFKSSFFTTIFGNNHGAGFVLHTSCVPACVPFQIALDPTRCSHLPVLNPTDGYSYLDLCPGENVHLAVMGVYNGGNYTQSDATTTFSWHLENTVTVNGTGLDSVAHTFTPGNGSEVVVTATDTIGCPAQQAVTFRTRSSANPITGTFNIPDLCVGETLTPSASTDSSSNIVIEPVEFLQPVSLSVSDTVFLPDGESCPPYGLYYRSVVTFTEFPAGSTLTSANDILYVRLKMEHSAVEDIQIRIFCPNGSSSTILPYPNFESTYDNSTFPATPHFFRVNLGSAYRPDGGSCNAALNPMGEPWNYVWSNNTTNGYQYASDGGNLFSSSNFIGHYNPHWDTELSPYFDTHHSFSVDSTDVSQMTQVYHPYQNFSSLVGCPLNGNWYIQVQDMLQYDNGYITEWELALNPQLMPTAWGYNVGVDTFYLSGTGVVNGHSITATEPGTQSVAFTVIDSFGCQFDSSFPLTVHPFPEVSLGEDLYVCPGISVNIHSTPTDNTCHYAWSTGSTASAIYTSEPGTYSVTATTDNSTCSASDTIELHNYVLSDTTFLRDTICQGYDYTEYGFSMSAEFLSQMFTIQPTWPESWFTGLQSIEDQHGCDSIVLLSLVVERHWQNEQTVFACERYVWYGDTLTESGDYVKDFVSQYGCDSTVTLHLDIGHPEEEEVWETVCGQYVWAGDTFTESGDYIRYFASMHDCDSAVTLHLTVIDTFLRTAVSNPDFCSFGETELSVEGNFDDYLWSTGEVGTSILVTESGLYTITASNGVCEQVERFDIPFCPLNILLPNAITPSKGDGLNDTFQLSDYDKSQIGDFSISIYDRWGEQVFYSEDKDFRWDGRKEGKLMVNVVYNYLIRCTDRHGKPHVYTGSITVL